MGRGLRVREIDLFKIRQQCGSNFGLDQGFSTLGSRILCTTVCHIAVIRLGLLDALALGEFPSFPLYKLKY